MVEKKVEKKVDVLAGLTAEMASMTVEMMVA